MDESFTTADLSHGERSELAWEPPSLSRLQDLLPQYKFLRLISRGGMGAVYQAVQLTLDRPVAIKILPPGIEHGEMNFAQRFKNEARLMAKLSQAGIISVFDFGQTADDHLYLVMEYVEGHTLHDMIRCDGKLSEDVAISYTQQLCEALQYAHDHGIIHRDIKPANILVNANGRLKIADFGLARPTAAYEQEVLLGTPDYVAPEIIESPTTVDHRADIYALGVVIYEMLAGDVPEKPRRPITDRAQIDTAWEDIIRRSTCDMPEHRYQKVSEIQAVVAKIAMRHRGDAVTPLPRKAADRRKKGNHMGLITVLASVVVLAAGGYWFWKTHGATGTDVIAESGSDHDDFPPRVITPPPAPAPVVVETKAPPAPAPTSAPNVAQAPEPQEPYHLPDMAPGHVFQIQEAHRDPINAVVLFADGYRVATASWDGTIKIWNLNKAEKGAVIRTLGPVEGKVTALGVSPDGKWVAGGDSNYTARVWDVQSGELKRQSTQRGRKITGLAFSSNGSQLAVASAEEGASLQLWNWQETDKGELLEVWSHIVNGLIPGPKSAGNTFITASGGLDRLFGRVSSEVIVGSFDTKAWVQALPPFSQIPTLVAMSGDGKAVAFTQKSAVQVVEVSTGKSLGHIGMPQAPVSLAVLDGGRLILSGQPDKTLRIWESTTGKEVYQAAASTYCTSSLAVSADQTYAVTGGGFSGGPELQKDGDYSPHVWALPKLSTLVSDEGRMILVLRNLDQLEKIDPELFKLRQAQIAEWDQKVAHADVRAAYQELDDKYVQALQRYVPSAAAVPREAYLAEISRVANQDPAPSASLTSWPAELKRLFDIYIQQCDLIKQKVDKEKETLGQSEHDKVAKLIAQREKQSDADGVMRAKAVLQELDERIHPAPPPPPVVSAPTVPSAVPPGGSGPATLPGEFKIVVPPLNPKSGLELQRPIVQGRVIAWPRSASGNSPEALGQVPADIGRAVSIGVGEKHALALHPDGTVVSWGHADARLQPPPVELDHVVAVAAGQIVSAFLREDGSVVAWNERNQIVIPPDTKPAVAIYTSMSSVFLRHKDGTLTYLSSNAFTMPNGVGPQPAPAPPAPTPPGTPTPTPTQPGKPGPPGPRPSIFSVPDDLNGVVADLNSVPDGAVALMADGTVRVWGRTNGSKNRRSSVISTIPLEKLTGGIAIGISTDLGWFLKQTGELIVWGPNVPSEFSRSLAFPGGVKLFRAYPANGVAIQSNTGSWRFLSSPNSPMAIDTLSAERFARGCTVVGIGATHVIGLKVE